MLRREDLVHMRRYRYQDLLLVPARGEAPTDNTTRLSFTHAGALADLDHVAEAVRALGGGEVTGPATMRWHAVELETRDPTAAWSC